MYPLTHPRYFLIFPLELRRREVPVLRRRRLRPAESGCDNDALVFDCYYKASELMLGLSSACRTVFR